MTAPEFDPAAALGGYAGLYQAIQQRMRPGGDLAADSAHQTMARHYANGTWTAGRLAAHRQILAEMCHRTTGKPRDGHAVLITAGPPGAGKTTALHAMGDHTRAGHLSPALPLRLDQYVTVDPDQVKHALLTRPDTRPRLADEQMRLPGGHRLAPAEMAGLVHAESRHLANQFALWAAEHGYNLLYDTTLRTLPAQRNLLTALAARGYTHRVAVSLDTPLHTALTGNATRWAEGRHAHDTGADPYGGRMAPEHHIRDLYPGGPNGPTTSRRNARHLADTGALTDLIELDRNPDPGTDPTATTIHIRHTAAGSPAGPGPSTIDVADRLRHARHHALEHTADTEAPAADRARARETGHLDPYTTLDPATTDATADPT